MTNIVMFVIIAFMKSVTISALKAHLSANLRLVRDGEELLVCERATPIARIVPYSCTATKDDYSEQRARLIAKGLLIPPRNAGKRLQLPPLPKTGKVISREVMEQVWQEERGGR